jgi:hypothetical protein
MRKLDEHLVDEKPCQTSRYTLLGLKVIIKEVQVGDSPKKESS